MLARFVFNLCCCFEVESFLTVFHTVSMASNVNKLNSLQVDDCLDRFYFSCQPIRQR